VAIAVTFEELVAAFGRLRDALQGLQLTVVEDRPPRNEVLMVERLGDAIDDLRGWLEEGLAGASDALNAVGTPFDADGARQALATANDRFIRLEYKFFLDVTSYEVVDNLIRFGRQRGREWLRWTASVKEALAQCPMPLRDVAEGLRLSWQELGERLGTASISVRTMNIAQQFTPTERDSPDAAIRKMT
jgi:hypothetical protein